MKLLKWSGLTCLMTVISIILLTSTAFAALNENVIKYRYYVTTVSGMPEFKGDVVLNFERDLSKRLLISEVKKSADNYAEILNHIDNKSTYEIVIYKEFLKELKESLASKEVFPSKLNDINLNYDHIYAPVFNEFSLESDKLLEMRELPENVKLTKRVYPYLRNNFYSKGKSGKELYKLLIDGISKEEDNPIEVAYKKAEAKLNEGYVAYNEEKYSESCALINESIPLWVKYHELVSSTSDHIGYLSGMLCLMSGSSAAEAGDLNQAKNLFISAARYFASTDEYQDLIAFAQCFIAEMYHRQGDIDTFIEWMELSKKNGLNDLISNKGNYEFANSAMGVKAYVMIYEYDRIKDPINTPQTDAEFRKKVISMLNWFQNLDDSTIENVYCKKFTKRYHTIMAYNSIILREISFYTAAETPAKRSNPEYIHIELKDHKPVGIIKPPHWLIALIDNQYVFDIKPAAVMRNKKIIIKANFYNFTNEPINNISKIIGEADNGMTFESNFKDFTIKPATNEINLTSNVPIDNKVFIFQPIIKWHIITSSNIKISLTSTSNHRIYVVRMRTLEPCYWQIVEHTCDWLKDLSSSQLTDDRSVVDTIWKGCSINSLTNLGYKYKYPMPEGEENDNLSDLLRKQYGKCGTWAEFLRHCFYCQGVRNVNTAGYGGDHVNFSFIEAVLGTNYSQVFIVNTNEVVAIGKVITDYFPNHALVGYGGKVVQDSQYGNVYEGGELFDIVFHVSIKNETPVSYENKMVYLIKEKKDSPDARKQDPNKQEFLLRYLKVSDSAPNKE